MTETRYKIILNNSHFYQELEIGPDVKHLRIGTDVESSIRLQRELFFDSFFLDITQENGQCSIKCSDNVFLDVEGDVRKLFFMKLVHGTEAVLRYLDSGREVLQLGFVIDFDYREKLYGCEIGIPDGSRFTIGASESDSIQLFSPHIRHDRLEVSARSGALGIDIRRTDYGLYYNGIRQNTSHITVAKGDFFSLAEYYFYYDGQALFTDSNDGIRVRGLTSVNHVDDNFLRYPCFQRNTRVKTVQDTVPVEILDPPEKPDKPKDNLLMSVMPALFMLVLTVVVRGFFSSMGGAFVIFSACSIGVGIITSIASFISGRKTYRLSMQERDKTYRNYIEEKRKSLAADREKERELLEYQYGNIQALLNKAEIFASDLFDRVPSDEDFLSVRLGTGKTLSAKPVHIREQERMVIDDELLYLPQKVRQDFRFIENTPVVLNLKMANAIGVVGEEYAIDNVIRNMVLDLAIRQHFDDLKMTFILSEQQMERYTWARFLPHLQSDGQTARSIACDPRSVTVLFEELYRELSWREEHVKAGSFTHLIVFVLDSSEFLKHPVSRFVSGGAQIGTTFVFCEAERTLLPLWCTFILQAGMDSGTILNTANDNEVQTYSYTPVSEEAAARAVIRLSPVYSDELSLEGGLVKTISLFSVLGIYETGDLDLAARWAASDVCRSMAAPLGVKSKKEPVFLDIHEKAHGPHGLVAGTTGSGKSEILQSYILALATLFHPYEVGFLIIDFKGGGMANQFENLPHLLGTITNIDGKQINRSLLSIRAELLKRQSLFAEAGVNHIDSYIRKYKKKEVEIPLPHLIIIVDEFAELKAEHPDFMKELISTARIGRSLGVHLILATQKPSGQVNEQIWSNSRFKLCLKVQSAEDSKEMLKSPLAAEIVEPGRAYFQVGNNEIFELFQSAYSGEKEKELQTSLSRKAFAIQKVSFEGWRDTVFEQKAEKSDIEARTQLEALVSYIAEYCRANPIEKLNSICAAPLEEVIPFPEESLKQAGSETVVEIGLVDDPEHQRKFRGILNLSTENMVVIGASQYGKTNLLQTIIRGVAASCSPAEASIYILDFGSMVLTNFAELPHVGGVVTSAEDEKFRNLIRMLQEEIRTRKEKMVAAGVTSLASYREAGHRDLPQIILMVDNFTAVKELYLGEDDVLLPICRDGLALGISVVLCNQQTSGLGYRYLANFSRRMALFCNEPGEYSAVINRCRVFPDNIAGRGVIEIDKEVFEIQTYLSFPGEREVERVDHIRDFTARMQETWGGLRARRIPEIPDIVTEQHLVQEHEAGRLGRDLLPVGLRFEDVTLKTIDFTNMGMIAVSGGDGRGKTTFLRNIMQVLYRQMFDYPAEVYLIDDIGRGLSEFRRMGIVQEYTIDAADVTGVLETMWETAADRWQQLSEGSLEDLREEPLLLLIIQNQEAITEISGKQDILKKYRELIGRYRRMKTGIVFSGLENTAISFSAPEVLKNIKEDRNVWFFDDLKNLKLFDIPVAVFRQYKKGLLPGDCYHFEGGDVEKIRTIFREEETF